MNRILATPSTGPRRRGQGISCLSALICLILVSCTTESRVVSAGEGPDTAAAAPADAKPAAPSETWDVYLLQGQRVGRGRTTVRQETEGGQTVLRTENTSHLSVKRAGQTSEQDIRSMSVETP